MAHVDEGQLHAYLDGELETVEPERHEELARHLEECAVCRARLEEARREVRESSAILEASAPQEITRPAFSDLERRARDQHQKVRWSRWTRQLAWAASIVLALGVGWQAGRLSRAGLTEGDAATGQPESNSGPTGAVPEERETGPGESDVAAQPSTEPAAAQSQAPAPELARTTGAAGGGRGAAAEETAAPPPAAGAGADRDREDAPAQDALEDQSATREELERATRKAATENREISAQFRAAAPLSELTSIDDSTAQSILGRPVARVADLPVVSLQRLPNTPLVLVTQRIASGVTLTLLEGPADGSPVTRTAFEPEGNGLSQARVTLGDLSVSAWAPLPRDSLVRLLERLE